MIDIPRLDLGLKQEIQDAVEFLRDNTQITDLRLIDDWLFPFGDGTPVSLDSDSFDCKEFA